MSKDKNKENLKDAEQTLKWIIERIEEEEDRLFEGSKANWKKAAQESKEEAYAALSRMKENQ